MHPTFILAVAAALLACSGQACSVTPAAAVSAFYDWHIKNGASGAPSPAEQLQMQPLVTAELLCLLKAARQMMEASSARYPDEKPPFVEGDLYSSMFEGPTSYKVGSISLKGKTRAVAEVRLSYKDKSGRSQWRDRVHLRREDGDWKVADFERNAGFAFGSSGSLMKGLYTELSKPAPELGFAGASACKR